MLERVSDDPNPWHFHLPLCEEIKVTVLKEAGETHLPRDCCSHQLAFPHTPSSTWQALRAICAGITGAQHSCRAIKHQICQMFLLWEHWKQGRNTNPYTRKQQEGGEPRISGKDDFRAFDHSTALENAGRRPSPTTSYPGICASPSIP